MNSRNIMNKISKLWSKAELKLLSKDIFKKYLNENNFPNDLPKKIDRGKLRNKCFLLYWSVESVQIELGYMLIHLNSYNNYELNKKEKNKELAYMLFNHHQFLCVEALYRVGERFTLLLLYIYKQEDDKRNYYYQNFYNDIKDVENFSKECIQDLKNHQKHWNELAKERNMYSHAYSKLTDGINFELKHSSVLNQFGIPHISVHETRNDLESVFNNVKEKYLYLENMDKTIQLLLKEIGK